MSVHLQMICHITQSYVNQVHETEFLLLLHYLDDYGICAAASNYLTKIQTGL